MSGKSKKRLKWAHFRFSVIGRLLAKPPDKGQLRKEIEKIADRLYLHPHKEKWVKFGVSTIERWYYQALGVDDPIKALSRKMRKDAGKSYAMSREQLEALGRQYHKYPDWSYQLHADNLSALIEEEPKLGKIPSYATVTRRMKERGWVKRKKTRTRGQKLAAKRLENFEVRSFESEYVHALWHLDFHECSRKVVDEDGTWHSPKVLCVLDDRSRLCCHIQWYLDETAHTLYHGLIQAFAKRGLPRSLMTDNGSAMIAGETVNGLMNLGIVHDKTLAYSPYQNGKQESFWGQVEGRLIAMLSRVDPLKLQFLNYATQAWVEQDYNRRLHHEIKTAPLDRMLDGPDVSRECPNYEQLQFAFTTDIKRTQRKSDGTISIAGVRFEVPSRFRHLNKVSVHYQSWDLSKAYLVDDRSGNRLANIYPQDKIKNSQGKRRSVEPLAHQPDESLDEKSEPIPPFLRKKMAEYAATGLPPAYITK